MSSIASATNSKSAATSPTLANLPIKGIHTYTAEENEVVGAPLHASGLVAPLISLILGYRGRYCWQKGELALQAKQVRTYLTNANLKGLDDLCDEEIVYKVHRCMAERYLPILPRFGGVKGLLAFPSFSIGNCRLPPHLFPRSDGDNTTEFPINETKRVIEGNELEAREPYIENLISQLFPLTDQFRCHITHGLITNFTLPLIKGHEQLLKPLTPLSTASESFIGITGWRRYPHNDQLEHVRIFRAAGVQNIKIPPTTEVLSLDSEEAICHRHDLASFSLIAYQVTTIFAFPSRTVETAMYCTSMNEMINSYMDTLPRLEVYSVTWVPGCGIIDQPRHPSLS